MPHFFQKNSFIFNRDVSDRRGRVTYCICQKYGLKQQKSLSIIQDVKFIIVLKVCKSNFIFIYIKFYL